MSDDPQDDNPLTPLNIAIATILGGIAGYAAHKMSESAAPQPQQGATPIPDEPTRPRLDAASIALSQTPGEATVAFVEKLSTRLRSSIIGQEQSIELVIGVFEGILAGTYHRGERPISFLAIGDTGTGKTETAKLVADSLGVEYFRIDMGSFKDQHGLWNWLGSPQGFVGGEGHLTRFVKQNPRGVLLFDEIEKGDSALLDFMLPLLDEGYITDRRTNERIDCSNSTVFMTSNLIKGLKRTSALDDEALRYHLNTFTALRQEWIARIQFVLPYFQFTRGDLVLLAKNYLAKYLKDVLTKKKLQRDFKLEVEEAVYEALLLGSDGVRSIQRQISSVIEPRLRKAFLAFRGASIGRVHIGLSGEQVAVVIE
jgi:ATP-dependent Clp protease ATP-binding subunit ClpB